MISPLSHSLPISAIVGGIAASIMAWSSADALTALSVATGAAFATWLVAMFVAQYLPSPEQTHAHHNTR